MSENRMEATAPFVTLGKEQMEALVGFQKELVGAYEQASQAWVDRVKSEVDSWSQLTSKLSGSRSPAETAGAYQEWIGDHLKMTMEDGRRLSDHCQSFIQKMSRSFGNGRPPASG